MNKLIIASAAGALMLGISASAFAQATPADCDTLFQRPDVNKDGSLQADEAKVFIDAMNKAQVKPQDASMIKKDEFLAACQKNAFVDIKPETVGTAAATQPATTDQSQTSTATKTEQPATTTATTEQPATTTTEQTAAATTEQTTQPTEQALAAPEGFLASNIIGATVYSQDDQSIGDINDIILSPQGEPSQVIVGVGGFLGLGEKDVVLDMSKLKIAATESGKVKIVVQTTPEELKNMPAFTKKQ
jgi:hypothetical protein